MSRRSMDGFTRKRGIAFSKKVRTERDRLGMSQSELAQAANVPVDTIRSLEQKKVLVPGVFLAADLVRALDGDLESWVFGERPEQQNNRKSQRKKG